MQTGRRHGPTIVTLSGVALGAAAALAYKRVLRPWQLRWGATDEEIGRTLSGDELVPDATYESTRAVTVHAPARHIWPWLVQLGQGRGGFYSYAWLENLIGADVRNADRILPAHQQLEVGDTVRFAPSERYGDYSRSEVVVLEPERALVLGPPSDARGRAAARYTGEGTWAFVLEPIDPVTTRLLVRTRSHAWGSRLLFVLFDPAHFVMERKMLLGIKQRAERQWQLALERQVDGGRPASVQRGVLSLARSGEAAGTPSESGVSRERPLAADTAGGAGVTREAPGAAMRSGAAEAEGSREAAEAGE